MINRCYNPKVRSFANYGGRGIAVCDSWRKSISFICWALSSGWRRGLTLDRKNNNGSYSARNCRWVTQRVNQNNRSDNIVLRFRGNKRTLAEWSRITKIEYGTLLARIKRGWSVEETLALRNGRALSIRFKGKIKPLREWAVICGINPATLYSRIAKQGWTVLDALTLPVTRANRRLMRNVRRTKDFNSKRTRLL